MDPSLYYFINQGCLTVDNMNDGDEMEIVEVFTNQLLRIVIPPSQRLQMN